MSKHDTPQARGMPPGAPAPPVDDDDNGESADDAARTVVVTFFTNHAATTKREQSLSLEALAERIHTTAASDKASLPWLKLARFGERRSEKNSLRHDDNVVAITGLEADYDRMEMSLAEAKDILARAHIAAILYPSPSYTDQKPKWRVLCPFSEAHPPAERDRFMARLNGLFGGIFSRESWALSQSYYYGRVANPDHHATVFDGTPIDLADHLDAGAIGRPKERNVGQKAQPTQKPADIAEARIRGLVTALLDNIRAAKDGEKHHTLRDICLTLGGYLHLVGWSVDEAVEQAISALPSADDWNLARDTARWAITRGMANPLLMEERPNPSPKQRNDPTDDPGYPKSQDHEATEQQPDDQQPPPGNWTHRWRAANGDHWVTPIGEPEPGSDGRQYVHVRYQGGGKQADGTPFHDGNSFVPFDELITRAEWEAEAAERAADFDARFHAPAPDDADDGYQASQDADADAAQRARPKRRKGPPPAPSAAELPPVWDPWEEPPPAAWPGGILSAEAEDTLAAVSLRDGLDLGLLCTTILAGASAAASKASRFTPYHDSPWSQPPIWWLMVIGESGVRKTHLDTLAISAIREARADLWRVFKAQLRDWEDTPKKDRGEKPQEPPALLCTDATPEGLRDALAASHRGTALVADELVVLLDFGRYSNRKEGGMAARGLFLSGYEDQPYEVRRANKPAVYLDHTGFSVFGGIQPKRLASLKLDWETDGMLQRLCGVRAASANTTQAGINIGNGMVDLHKAIKRICFHDARNYSTTHDGSTIIRDTETAAAGYALLTDYGDGWPGFCRKLHGTEARLALILHLLEDPTEPIIPTERVRRAHRLIHGYVLQHATDFHGSMGGGRSLRQDVAGWMLTRGDADPNPTEMERITASDLTSNVRACRDLPSKMIGDMLDRFITGGWLTPETDFPNNRGWYFNPAIRCGFAERAVAERSRRKEARDAIQRIAAQRRKPTS